MQKAVFKALMAAVLGLTLATPSHAQRFLRNFGLTAKEDLGRRIFFDTSLSSPPGQACSSCHDPAFAFSDPNAASPTSKGANPEIRGSRNAPSIMYASFSPRFHFDRDEGLFIGGQFLDGRSPTVNDQAKQPFLNPIEMGNASGDEVVEKIRQADYAHLFERVFGAGALANPKSAYNKVGDALAAFERSPALRRFTSKYDYALKGRARLTAQETRGRKLYEAADKGNCAACHPNRPGADSSPPLFTDFTYDNLGVPSNPDNPFYSQPGAVNPLGKQFVDKGLGGRLDVFAENGKFKVPTLRNIAVTGPYMHNGYFTNLRSVVEFYSNRDVKPVCPNRFTRTGEAQKLNCWPEPEVKENLNRDELGALNLSNQEIDDLVAFLKTLTDGYKPK
ncbi:cytochrome-c peroxidase [Methyloterricola oryzae]|uniref:cytochrome-c peroxidase n=1 Tax=Methyloterricola oryzae TaxID=1495050 RepID=UPI0009E247D0|nr:cytochrome c peroxidase [Methyloterricola oryzae]